MDFLLFNFTYFIIFSMLIEIYLVIIICKENIASYVISTFYLISRYILGYYTIGLLWTQKEKIILIIFFLLFNNLTIK